MDSDCESSSSSSNVGRRGRISSPDSTADSRGALGCVLVAGCTGFLGQYLTLEALGQGWEVHALVRPETLDDLQKDAMRRQFSSMGAKVVIASYDDHESLVKACRSVDVVLSCVGVSGVEAQLKLIKAAKEADCVSRFVPSEFGAYTKAMTSCGCAGKYAAKQAVQEELEKSGLGYMFVTSYCLTSCWVPGLGNMGQPCPPEDVVPIIGDGSAKAIFVDEIDVARYTIRAMADPRTLNKTVHITPRANILSQNDLVSIWEEKTGAVLKKAFVAPAEIEGHMKGTDDPAASALLQLQCAMFVVGSTLVPRDPRDLELTELYPSLQYTPVDDYLEHFLCPTFGPC